MTFLIMTVLIAFNTGEITYNDITYNGCHLWMTSLITDNKNICM